MYSTYSRHSEDSFIQITGDRYDTWFTAPVVDKLCMLAYGPLLDTDWDHLSISRESALTMCIVRNDGYYINDNGHLFKTADNCHVFLPAYWQYINCDMFPWR